MKLARFSTGNETLFGIVDGDRVTPIEGDLFGPRTPRGESLALDSVKLLAPVVPRLILALALNYPSHLGQAPASPRPELFVKGNNTLADPDDAIVLPAGCSRTDYEGELVAVIGRRCSKVSVADALHYVLGYTCGNDVSARQWQGSDMQWFRGKSLDGFGPIGPWIVEDLDPTNLDLRTRLNGEEVQHCNTGEMINSVAESISFASRWVTLEPGDLFFTGTSGRPRALNPGDVVEVEVSGIGVLRNSFIADPAPMPWEDLRQAVQTAP